MSSDADIISKVGFGDANLTDRVSSLNDRKGESVSKSMGFGKHLTPFNRL